MIREAQHMTIRWVTGFFDFPVSGFQAERDFWLGVTGYALSPPRSCPGWPSTCRSRCRSRSARTTCRTGSARPAASRWGWPSRSAAWPAPLFGFLADSYGLAASLAVLGALPVLSVAFAARLREPRPAVP